MNEGKFVTYDDFSGGDWNIRKYSHIPKNMWKGSNVQVWPDGSLGPRSTMNNIVPTGLPTTSTSRPQMLFARDGKVFFIMGAGALYYGSSNSSSLAFVSAVSTATGTLTGGTSSSAAQLYTDTRLGRYWINRAGVGMDYMTSGGTVTAVPGIPTPFRLIAVKGDRMYGCAGRVLYYSAAGDYTSWPALNQLDLGEGSDIQFLHPSGDTLYVGTESTIYAVQGVPGFSTVVRQVIATGAPDLRNSSGGTSMNAEPWRTARLADDTLAWVCEEDGLYMHSSQTVPGYGRCKIAWFSGGKLRYSEHPDYAFGDLSGLAAGGSTLMSSPSYEVFHVASRDSLLLFPMGARSATTSSILVLKVRQDGYTEQHSFNFATHAFGPSSTPIRSIAGPQVAWDRSGTMSGAVVGLATWDGTNAYFWYWKTDPGLDAGTLTSDSTSNATFNATATLSPFYSPDGSLVRVRSVIVHGTFYDGSSSSLSCQPRTLGVEGVSDSRSFAAIPDPLQTVNLTSTYGVNGGATDRYIHKYRFGNTALGRGFTLDFSMTQCSISKVIVNYDVRPGIE